MQGSRANWKAPRRHVGDVMRMTIATVLAATFSISVSAQEFLAGWGRRVSPFQIPIARWPTSLARSGTAKRSGRCGEAGTAIASARHQIRDHRRGYWRRQRLLRQQASDMAFPTVLSYEAHAALIKLARLTLALEGCDDPVKSKSRWSSRRENLTLSRLDPNGRPIAGSYPPKAHASC